MTRAVSTRLEREIEAANLADMATEDQKEAAHFYWWARFWMDNPTAGNCRFLATQNQRHAARHAAQARAALFKLIGNGS